MELDIDSFHNASLAGDIELLAATPLTLFQRLVSGAPQPLLVSGAPQPLIEHR